MNPMRDNWFKVWLGLQEQEINSSDIHITRTQTFYQATIKDVLGTRTPLSPLRERGYIIAHQTCENECTPSLLLAGDWCIGVGSVSSTIQSGDGAARCMNQILDNRKTTLSI